MELATRLGMTTTVEVTELTISPEITTAKRWTRTMKRGAMTEAMEELKATQVVVR
ncbi:hypothetical protein [Halalkalicoccus ordinarius]|uniref:hypothetical protein n=1 Tax=Halalkalicoccus ordinarius TaxID=3116651 RepID=UPI00300F5FB4